MQDILQATRLHSVQLFSRMLTSLGDRFASKSLGSCDWDRLLPTLGKYVNMFFMNEIIFFRFASKSLGPKLSLT